MSWVRAHTPGWAVLILAFLYSSSHLNSPSSPSSPRSPLPQPTKVLGSLDNVSIP